MHADRYADTPPVRGHNWHDATISSPYPPIRGPTLATMTVPSRSVEPPRGPAASNNLRLGPLGGGFRCQVEALLGDLGVVLGLKTDAICGHDGPDAGESAEGGKGASAREHVGRLGVERRPPDERCQGA